MSSARVQTRIHSAPPRASWAWLGIALAPLAWAAHIGARYPLVQVACGSGTSLPLHAVSAACTAVALVGLVAAVATVRRSTRARVSDTAPEQELAPLHAPDARRLHRIGFLARAGVVNSAVFLGAIALEALTAFVHDPCTRALAS